VNWGVEHVEIRHIAPEKNVLKQINQHREHPPSHKHCSPKKNQAHEQGCEQIDDKEIIRRGWIAEEINEFRLGYISYDKNTKKQQHSRICAQYWKLNTVHETHKMITTPYQLSSSIFVLIPVAETV